jgi:hypothetical protein
MKRRDVLLGYSVSGGRITTLGRFEGEPIYAPYFWGAVMDGGGEELAFMDDGGGQYAALVEVTDKDRAEFPELRADTVNVLVIQSDVGFISATELDEEETLEVRREYADG